MYLYLYIFLYLQMYFISVKQFPNVSPNVFCRCQAVSISSLTVATASRLPLSDSQQFLCPFLPARIPIFRDNQIWAKTRGCAQGQVGLKDGDREFSEMQTVSQPKTLTAVMVKTDGDLVMMILLQVLVCSQSYAQICANSFWCWSCLEHQKVLVDFS